MSAKLNIAPDTALAGMGNVVPDGYSYYEKITTADEDLILPTAVLKWYNLYPETDPISPEQVLESRAFLETAINQMKFAGDLGFVILHRAGSVLLLLLTTWRNTNEMWEAVYVKDLTQRGGYQHVIVEGSHRPTYCVWELGAVWHERQAWVRFLSSARDEQAKRAYIEDTFAGCV
jgi:hypothetical protein